MLCVGVIQMRAEVRGGDNAAHGGEVHGACGASKGIAQ